MKHIGTIYGHEISNDPYNKKSVSIYKSQHAHAVLDHIQDMVEIRENIFMRLQATWEYKEKVLILTAATYAGAKIALLDQNNIM